MNKKLFSIIGGVVVLGIIIGVTWFINVNHKEIKEISYIKLECANDRCPFEQKSFEDTAELKKFQHAMSKANKLKDDIDVAARFWMYVTFKDGAQKKYTLSINEEYLGQAIYRNVENNDYYSIPKSQADILRPIIYND